MFPCCSTREYLSIDVSIINVGLISTKPGLFLFSGKDKIQFNQFQTFFFKNQPFGFQCCSTREELSIDVSITNVLLTSTKPGRFLFSGMDKIQFHQFRTFLKKQFNLLGFHAVVLVKTFPLMYQLLM